MKIILNYFRMSSKGDHETTNDGSDSKHREKIAAHYKGWLISICQQVKTDFLESAKTKTGLKWYLLCTLIVDGLIGAHIYLKKAKV